VTDTAIRPFQLAVAQVAIDDLHTRLARARWPDEAPPEQGAPWAYGTSLAFMRELVQRVNTSALSSVTAQPCIDSATKATSSIGSERRYICDAQRDRALTRFSKLRAALIRVWLCRNFMAARGSSNDVH
jgi:hypothetical protein